VHEGKTIEKDSGRVCNFDTTGVIPALRSKTPASLTLSMIDVDASGSGAYALWIIKLHELCFPLSRNAGMRAQAPPPDAVYVQQDCF